MVLNIKDPETDRLARELAAATGESITVAARTAIEERLERVRQQQRVQVNKTALYDIIDRARSRPTLDDRPEDDILGLDELGIPT